MFTCAQVRIGNGKFELFIGREQAKTRNSVSSSLAGKLTAIEICIQIADDLIRGRHNQRAIPQYRNVKFRIHVNEPIGELLAIGYIHFVQSARDVFLVQHKQHLRQSQM